MALKQLYNFFLVDKKNKSCILTLSRNITFYLIEHLYNFLYYASILEYLIMKYLNINKYSSSINEVSYHTLALLR